MANCGFFYATNQLQFSQLKLMWKKEKKKRKRKRRGLSAKSCAKFVRRLSLGSISRMARCGRPATNVLTAGKSPCLTAFKVIEARCAVILGNVSRRNWFFTTWAGKGYRRPTPTEQVTLKACGNGRKFEWATTKNTLVTVRVTREILDDTKGVSLNDSIARRSHWPFTPGL